MTTYQRKQTPERERVEAVRMTRDREGILYIGWSIGNKYNSFQVKQPLDWLVVHGNFQRFMSDDEFRREFEEVPTANDGKWITIDGRPVEKISVAYNEVSRRVDKPWKPLTHADLDHVDKPHSYQCAICKAPATLHNLCCCGHAKCIGCANCCRIRGNIEAFANPTNPPVTGQPVEHFNGGWWSERRGECEHHYRARWTSLNRFHLICELCGTTKR